MSFFFFFDDFGGGVSGPQEVVTDSDSRVTTDSGITIILG